MRLLHRQNTVKNLLRMIIAVALSWSVDASAELKFVRRLSDTGAFLAEAVQVNEERSRPVASKRRKHERKRQGKKSQKTKVASVARKQKPTAAAQTKIAKKEAKASDKESSSSWSQTVGVEHYGGFYEDVDPASALFVSLGYKLGESGYNLGLAQSVSKFYYVMPGDSDFKLNDTQLSVSGPVTSDLALGWSLNGSLSATLPVSENSQRQDVLSKVSLALPLSRGLFSDQLSVSLAPYARYYWNRYTTTVTTPGSGGGNPLPKYLMGANLSLSFKVTDKWTLKGTTGYNRLIYEQVDYQNEVSTYGYINPPVHSYVWKAAVHYQVTGQWGVHAGYSHGDRVEKPWGTEVLLFNDRVSQWYLGTVYSL